MMMIIAMMMMMMPIICKYSSQYICLCVCVCVCVHGNSENNRSIQLETVVYEIVV